MTITTLCAVLAFITTSHCSKKPINCSFQDTLMSVCASNGRTYETECDYIRDKLYVDRDLHIVHLGNCYDRAPKKKQKKHRYIKKRPPQYIIEEEVESPDYIIEETIEEDKPWTGIIKDIVKKKVQITKNVLNNVQNTIESLINYNNKKTKKKILYKKKVNEGCIYCP